MSGGTNRNLPKVRDNSIAIKDHNITVPQLILPLLHTGISSIHLFKVQRLKDLERAPSMVHEYFHIQIRLIVAVHGEPARLRQ